MIGAAELEAPFARLLRHGRPRAVPPRALTLSVLGGLVGMLAGIVAAERLAAQFGWPMLVRPAVAALAIAFSALVGVVFGMYPARKASLMDPIEALRYE